MLLFQPFPTLLGLAPALLIPSCVHPQSKLFAPSGSKVRLPVAHMVCNQMPPIGDKPSLMTFREVETLFHE